jgi:hypothetical protein
VDQNSSYNLLCDRITQLEESINSISTDINTFTASQTTNDSSESPQVESSVYRDSEELVNIARSLALSTNSVASTEVTQSTASTLRALDLAASSDALPVLNEEFPAVEHENYDEVRDDNSLSVIGVPLAAPRLHGVNTWIQETRTAERQE